MYFQDLILKLQTYWASRNCILTQGYDQEVGAGTMNPATFLRVLGPEPWNVAYVEPSRRPADGRYGENPNRLYQHALLCPGRHQPLFERDGPTRRLRPPSSGQTPILRHGK